MTAHNAMSAPRLIERWTPDGTLGTKTFLVPAGYSNLRLRAMGRGTDPALQNILMRFNGDAGANSYDYQFIRCVTNTFQGGEGNGVGFMFLGVVPASGDLAGAIAEAHVDIPRYGDAALFKGFSGTAMAVNAAGSGGARVYTVAGMRRNVEPITSLTVYLSAGNWALGSVLELFAES